MSQQPISVGENFKLKSLSDPTINLNAYYQGFINIESVEPSLGLPSNITFTSPNSTYYFPVVTVHPTYGNSRKFTNNGNLLTINKNNIGIGTATPASKLTVVGDISARGRLYAEDRPYTMLFSLSSIKPTKGNNTIYTGISTIPLYSNIGGGDFNAIDYSLYSTIAGGALNNINYTSHFSIIGGGAENSVCGFFSSILGGECNIINSGDHSVIVGGFCNALFSNFLGCQNSSSSIVGGSCNTIMGYCGNFIGGGVGNYMDDNTACGSILGGWDNCMINGEAAVILGGARNKIVATEMGNYPDYDELTNDESYSFIGTGSDNYISGIHSAILAGRQNSLSGSNSFILGSLIKTDIHNTTFVNNLSSQGILHGTSLRALTGHFGEGKFENDLTVFGNLSVLGTRVEINTNFLNTSAIRIVNPGEGPALYVHQINSNYDVAQFLTESEIPVLTIKNTAFTSTARVGVNTDEPNTELTVVGDISATGTIYGNFDLTGVAPYVYSQTEPSAIIPASGNNSIPVGSNSNIGGGTNNQSCGSYSHISNGCNNCIAQQTTFNVINSGDSNKICIFSNNSNIGNGRSNSIVSSNYSSILNGFENCISGSCYSFVGSGSSHHIFNSRDSLIGVGYNHLIQNSCCSLVVGGTNNIILNTSIYPSYHNIIVGGDSNCICGIQVSYNVIGGGSNNTISTSSGSTIAGGSYNTSSTYASGSTISGGSRNSASGYYTTISGGYCNSASGYYSTIGGGRCNTASVNHSTVSGGYKNHAGGQCSTVSGGYNNCASCNSSIVVGGLNNTASFYGSIVVGGSTNTASGSYSFIAGGSNNNTNGQSNTFILGSNIIASQPNYTYVNNLSVEGGSISSPGSETIISDGINFAGNGDFTLSLNFANGVYVQNDLHLGNGSNNFDAKIQANVTDNRTFGLPDSTGTFVVATSGIRNFAAPIASSNVATVTRTIQVFDSTGTSIGHIPLYATRS